MMQIFEKYIHYQVPNSLTQVMQALRKSPTHPCVRTVTMQVRKLTYNVLKDMLIYTHAKYIAIYWMNIQ